MLGAAVSGTAPAVDAVRLGLHVLAATVWVGGQIVMLGLLPAARSIGGDAPKQLARAFARLAWPAYALLWITGLWNISTFTFSDQSTAWKVVLWVKVVLVAVAGAATFLHGRARSRAGLAAWGSIAGIASIAALFMGVALAGP
jgi:putative copper export protein